MRVLHQPASLTGGGNHVAENRPACVRGSRCRGRVDDLPANDGCPGACRDLVLLPDRRRRKGRQRGSPTGGGNFYLFKKSTPAQQQAPFRFIKWITTPERAAQWGIDTGYVAVRADAWETPVMKQYVAGFPAAAVARDQLPYAKAELSTHDNQRVTKALNDGLQAALTGTKSPEQAMKDAQREAERLLRSYKK